MPSIGVVLIGGFDNVLKSKGQGFDGVFRSLFD